MPKETMTEIDTFDYKDVVAILPKLKQKQKGICPFCGKVHKFELLTVVGT